MVALKYHSVVNENRLQGKRTGFIYQRRIPDTLHTIRTESSDTTNKVVPQRTGPIFSEYEPCLTIVHTQSSFAALGQHGSLEEPTPRVITGISVNRSGLPPEGTR